MCDKDNCNCGSNPCCGDCEPWNCIEQAVNDVWATKEDQIEELVERAETAATNSEASAQASAGSAAEAKEFRDEAEQAATTAVAAEGIVVGVANDLQDTADKLKQIADELGTAIAGISVVTWYYTAVSDNQTVIPVPSDKNQVDVQAIFIEGARQEPNRGFTYDALNKEITLAEGIPLGLEISIIIGTYSDNPNDFANTLASDNGASLVGTASGNTVQEELNSISDSLTELESNIDPKLREDLASAQPGLVNISGIGLRFTPIAYGAVADGVTKDTAAFVACMSAAPAGSTIDLQGGVYLAECTVTKNNIHITNGKIIAPYDAAKGCIVADGLQGVKVSNVQTFVDKANKTLYSAANVSGIHFENCQNVSVDHVFADGSKNDTYLLTGSWGCPIHAYMSSGVTITSCHSINADKEGIMTRMSDDVWITNCTSTEAGYSCIGTSGGNRATISRCRATGSGATVITMNNRVSNVLDCIIDGGGAFAGINIGHDTEAEQYALDASVSGNIIRNCVGNGVSISKGQRVTASNNIVTNVTLDGVHIHSMTGNTANLLSVTVSGNTVVSAGRSGIWCYESDPTLNTSYTITGNQLDQCTLYGIRVNANRSINIKSNTLRAITDIAIFIRPADNSTSNTSDSITIDGNTLVGSTASAITLTPAKMVAITNNNLYGFNSSNGAFSTAIVLNGSISGVNYTLPNELQINGNIIEGSVGASTTIINISTDNDTGANRQLQINSNLIRNSGALLTYPAARYILPQVRNNTKGLDATLVSAIIPASGTLVVSNSNQTAYSNPRLTARNAAGLSVFVSSIVDGSVTLSNASTASANVNLEW